MNWLTKKHLLTNPFTPKDVYIRNSKYIWKYIRNMDIRETLLSDIKEAPPLSAQTPL